MPTTIEARKTPLAAEEAAVALAQAFYSVMGRSPSAETLAVLLAKCALETGRFQKIWQFNFGNIKAGADYSGFCQSYRCNEVINGKVVWFDPPHVQCRFRAYGSAAEGAVDYLQLLTTSKRYALAFSAALRGDPVEFVNELKRAGYMTADVAPYRKAVVSLCSEFRLLCARVLLEMPTIAPPPEPVEHSAFSDDDFDDVMRHLDKIGASIADEVRQNLTPGKPDPNA